ncbi:uncharacterized protein LOC121602873 [Anopheles merus]|uniref:uncharacterized protein LOC121602873 n=1 Tax=Anopheles merus TaxID=30066 RepID=UPI001BE443B2|nr:uncharacterized protein LOC121602873 [Anopheles merus]
MKKQSQNEVCTVISLNNIVPKWWIDLTVNNITMRIEVDTGSPLTIIGKQCYEKYFKHKPLQKCNVELVSYTNNAIEVLGTMKVKVDKEMLPLYVVNLMKRPLLGREWLNAVPDWNNLLQKYADVFDPNLGKISGVQAQLTLKDNAQSIFLKARRVPFNKN